MKRFATLFAALMVIAGTASAALRSPQVTVLGGGLQGYLNSADGGINASADQNAAQRWAATVSNNSTFTIQVELSGNAASNALGLYNASAASPTLYQVFPGAATTGWFAVASFRNTPTRVVVNLFDDTAALQGTTTYLGADRNDFGFYIAGSAGTFYTQDSRNSGNAQALTYAGTGMNAGQWFLCFEEQSLSGGSDQDYDDAVLFLESVNPTPVSKASWGTLKSRFR
jgi:hypothetical protein